MKAILVFLSSLFLSASFAQNEEIKYFSLKDTSFEVGSIYQIDSIEYDFDGNGLRPHSREVLNSIFDFLLKNKQLIIQISTHTDERGNDQYNLQLSERRSKQVVDFLNYKGIPYDRLVSHGYGETNPYTTRARDSLFEIGTVLSKEFIYALGSKELQEEAHQLNRRTEMKILAVDYTASSDQYEWKQELFQNQKWNLDQFVVVDGIYFALGKHVQRPESEQRLNQLYDFMVQNDSLIIEIAYHRDCRGSSHLSYDLTHRRAQSIAEYLIDKGIPSERLVPKGYGENKPRKYNGQILSCDYILSLDDLPTQERLHQLNRRAEFRILATNYYEESEQSETINLKKDHLFILPHPKSELGNDLNPDRDSTILVIYNYLKENPKVSIIIEVHTDCRGSEEGNLRLSGQIGSNVKSDLQTMGILAERIQIVPKGESEPLIVNQIVMDCAFIEGVHSNEKQEELHAKNRRLVIKINPIEYDY